MGQKILDTNIIIRFLTNDPPQLADKAQQVIQRANPHQLIIPDMVIAEIIWVLLSFYNLEKPEVIKKIESLIASNKFDLNRPVLEPALQLYRIYNISFIDAYLLSLSIRKNSPLISFDQDLNKVFRLLSPSTSNKN